MHKRIASVIMAAVLLVSGLMAAGCPAVAVPEEAIAPTTITILHTNDLHARANPFARPCETGTVGGLSRIATVVENIRAEGQPVLVLDAGDTFHGTGIGHYTRGQVMVKAMNAIGYDAMVVSNHDFNWGIDALFATMENSYFPFLSANLRWREDDSRVFTPYIILERDDVRIGVLGLSPTINRYRHQGAPDPRAKIARVDPVEVAQELIPALREQVDVIVVLSHLGHPADRDLAREVDGIDIILGASTHWLLTEPVQVGETLIVEQGWRGEFMARLDLTLQEGEVIAVQHQLIHLNESIAPNPEVQAIIDAAYADFPEANRVVGYSVTDIWAPEFNPFDPEIMPFLPEPEPGTLWAEIHEDIRRGVITFRDSRAPNTFRETVLGNFIADAIRYQAGTDVAVQRAGCIRAGVASGEITVDDLFTMLPFDMSIVVYNLSGDLLRQLLEVSVAEWPGINSNFLQVSGLKFTFDPTREEGERLTNVYVAGVPLDPAKIYSVAVTHSPARRVWGRVLRNIFGQGEFVRDTGVFVRDAFANYLEVHSPISPAVEGRIRAVGIEEAVAPTTITILHTGDFHGRLDPFKPRRAEEYVGGIARIATLVNQIRAEQPNTILLDAGDTIHGTNLANLFEGESVIAAMNAVGYTAMVVGNHDFHFGSDGLLERAEQAEFPTLGANVRYRETGEPFLPPYTIVEAGGLRIGIIGLVTTRTPIVTHPKNVQDLEFLDMVAVTRETVEQIAPQVDLIVLLAHTGTPEVRRVLMEVPGIAVSVNADAHLEQVEQIGDTILAHSGAHGKVLGRLDIVVENGIVIDFSHEFLRITPDIEDDPSVNAVLTPYREQVGMKLAEVIGEAEVVLAGEREDIRSRETNLGNLVADVIRERAGADVAIQNSGGIRASIDAGPITLEEIFTVLPFDNYVVALRLTGETIWEALENAVSDESPTGAFPQVSGMSFVFDPARPSGDRIVEVTIGGKPLDLERTYVVATNCFLAAGGDKFTMLKDAEVVLETGDFLRDAVAAYIRERRTIRPEVEGRIRAVGIEEAVTITPINQVDMVCDEHGLPARLGEEVTIEGVATVGTGVISTRNTIIFVQDETGGIGVFAPDIAVPVRAGDRVRITGEVGHFHGFTQLVNPQIEILGHNNPLPQVKPIDNLGRLTQFETAEPIEGELVSVHVRISSIPDRPRGGAYNVAVTDIHGENRIIVRVGLGTEINVQELKVHNEYIITGIVGQRDLFKPHQEGYRIFPRSEGDLLLVRAGTPPEDSVFPFTNTVAANVDGDGIILENPVVIDGNEVFEVRFLGIDAPEIFPIDGFAYYNQVKHGERAAGVLRYLTPVGTEITLNIGPRALCGLGRLIAVVKVNSLDVNKELLRRGYVVKFVVWPNSYDHGRFEALRSAMLEAKEFERGIWCATDPLEEIPLVYRDRIFGHPRYIGDFETKRYVRFERMEEIPLKNRVYFFRHDAVVDAGYTPK